MNTKPNHNPFTSSYDKNLHAYKVGDEPMIFHCHHYNLFLQQTIEDGSNYIDAPKVLTQAAEHSVYHQFKKISEHHTLSLDTLLSAFSLFGFGVLSVEAISEQGGTLHAPYDHYATGYISKHPSRKENQPSPSYFTQGFINALFAFHYNKPPYSYTTTVKQCIAKGSEESTFEVKLNPSPESPASDFYAGKGVNSEIPVFENPSYTSIDYLAIREALISMPIEGSPETGLIDAFGVLLTRHYANYYCNISYALLKGLVQNLGEDLGYKSAHDLLVEAGHICGFNTMGGIMLSMEWDALIKPMIKTREDWVHGIIACINALGWGTWIIEELVPNELIKVRIYNDYEGNHFLMINNPAIHKPSCFLATGVVASIMNLIYHSDITQRPTLNEEFYYKTFKTPGRFIGKQIKCRSLGDGYGLIEAKRS